MLAPGRRTATAGDRHGRRSWRVAAQSSSTSRSRSRGLNGLGGERSCPADRARVSFSCAPAAVSITMVAFAAPLSWARMRRHASMPSIGGMSMSRKTSSGWTSAASATASTPLAASWSRKPATSSSVVETSLRMNGSSSAIRTLRIADLEADAFQPRRRDLHEGGHDLGIELRAGRLVDHRAGLEKRRRRAGGPDGGQRVEDVVDGDHAGRQRDDVAGEPVGVAGAVPALMVVAHDELGLAQEVYLAQDLPPDDRMALHQRALG